MLGSTFEPVGEMSKVKVNIPFVGTGKVNICLSKFPVVKDESKAVRQPTTILPVLDEALWVIAFWQKLKSELVVERVVELVGISWVPVYE